MRSRLLQASCASCQRVCPVDAIDLTMRAPVVDTKACTLCGICTSVCPETVFSLPTQVPSARGAELFIASGCHPLVTSADHSRCTHSIGLRDLAQMWLNGVRRLVVATGSCVLCDTAKVVSIETSVANFNQLAASRNLDGIELTSASPAQVKDWQGAQTSTDTSRRAFLRRFIPPPGPESPAQSNDVLQQFLATGDQTAPTRTLYPFSPRIDPSTCSGCDDCLNICPHDALTLIKAENGKPVYHCAPERCTGCQLCSDICDTQAVEVLGMESRGADIFLRRFQCRACGVQSHTTLAHPPADGLCHICQQTKHHSKLFVVLD